MTKPCDNNQIPYVPSFDPEESFKVSGKDGISVTPVKTGSMTDWQVGLYTAPSATIYNDSPIMECGDTNALVQWTANSADGSEIIQTRTLAPDPGITGTIGTYQFTNVDVTSDIAGEVAIYTLTVDDQAGAPVVKTSGVNFQFKVFQGFNSSDSLTEGQIEALINQSPQTSIMSLYGGTKDYVIPSINHYIYWVYETNTAGITSAILNGLPLPLEVVGTVSVTNAFALSANYTVVRTANRFGVGTLTISLS